MKSKSKQQRRSKKPSKPKTPKGVASSRLVSGRDFWLARKQIYALEKTMKGTRAAAMLADAREMIGMAQVSFEFHSANGAAEGRSPQGGETT